MSVIARERERVCEGERVSPFIRNGPLVRLFSQPKIQYFVASLPSTVGQIEACHGYR